MSEKKELNVDAEVKKEEETSEEIILTDVVSDSDAQGINISEEVVATIAGMAAQEVKGVASLNASGIGEMIGIKTRGVKVQSGEKDTVIDISITVDYGSRIPDVAWEVQNKVKTQVESMTGLNVVAVNVHVQSVVMPKKKNEKQDEKAKLNEATEVEVVEKPEESTTK